MSVHKVVRVRIRHGDFKKGESQLVYPDRYNPHEVDRLGSGVLDYSGHIGRGQKEEWCLIALPEDVANEYAIDPDMEIVSAVDADAMREQWRVEKGEPEEVVSDPNRMMVIIAKKLAGLDLSDEDMLALDPDSDVPGVEKRVKKLSKQLKGRGFDVE